MKSQTSKNSMKKPIGDAARETMSKIYAEKDALRILKQRHYLEYKAIYQKRLEIRLKVWKKK